MTTRTPRITHILLFSEMTKLIYRIWTTLTVAGIRTACEGISQEDLDPAQRLLLDISTWMPRAKIDLQSTPCGGRCIPWPTITDTKSSMDTLINEEIDTRGQPYNNKPHLTQEVDDGQPVTISSGVGTWAKAVEATWTYNRRLWWQHTTDLPDWTDYQVEDRFKINRFVDLIIKKATPRDSGRYTARFRLQPDGPVYTMETDLTVHRHPQPRITSQYMEQGARRLTLNHSDTSMELKCNMVKSHPRVVLGWEKDSEAVPETDLSREHTPNAASVSLKVTRADNRSLITCSATDTLTSARKSATIGVRVLGPPDTKQGLRTTRAEADQLTNKYQTQGREAHSFMDGFMKEFLPGENNAREKKSREQRDPNSAEWEREHDRAILGTTTEKLTVYLMASVALSAATIGATLTIISKCNGQGQGARYHLTRTYTTR